MTDALLFFFFFGLRKKAETAFFLSSSSLKSLHLFQKILMKYLLCSSTKIKTVLDFLSTRSWVLYMTNKDQVSQQNTSLNGIKLSS